MSSLPSRVTANDSAVAPPVRLVPQADVVLPRRPWTRTDASRAIVTK